MGKIRTLGANRLAGPSMHWIEIQIQVPVEGPEDANHVVSALGDVLAGGHRDDDDGTEGRRPDVPEEPERERGGRPWFMTSEFRSGGVGELLEDLLRSSRRSPGRPWPRRPAGAGPLPLAPRPPPLT